MDAVFVVTGVRVRCYAAHPRSNTNTCLSPLLFSSVSAPSFLALSSRYDFKKQQCEVNHSMPLSEWEKLRDEAELRLKARILSKRVNIAMRQRSTNLSGLSNEGERTHFRHRNRSTSLSALPKFSPSFGSKVLGLIKPNTSATSGDGGVGAGLDIEESDGGNDGKLSDTGRSSAPALTRAAGGVAGSRRQTVSVSATASSSPRGQGGKGDKAPATHPSVPQSVSSQRGSTQGPQSGRSFSSSSSSNEEWLPEKSSSSSASSASSASSSPSASSRKPGKSKRKRAPGEEKDERLAVRIQSKGVNRRYQQIDRNTTGLTNERERYLAKVRGRKSVQPVGPKRQCRVSTAFAQRVRALLTKT